MTYIKHVLTILLCAYMYMYMYKLHNGLDIDVSYFDDLLTRFGVP